MTAPRSAPRRRKTAPALPACSADDLAGRLKGASPPRTVLLMGPDAAQQRLALEVLVDAIRVKLGGGAEVVRISALPSEKGGDGWDVAAVFDELHTAVLFGSERVLVVHHAGSLGKELAERLAARLGGGEASPGYLLLCDPTAEPPETPGRQARAGSPPAALAVACGEGRRSRGGGQQGKAALLVARARRRAKQLGRELPEDLARHLVERVGSDRAALDAAVEVLVARVGDSPAVSAEALAGLERLPEGGDSWQWVDAALRGDLSAALAALRAIFDWGICFRGEARKRRGEAELGPPLIGAMASRLRMVEERGWPRTLDPLVLQRITAILLRADRAVKGGWSTLGAYGALERATLEICRIVNPGAWKLRGGKRP